MKIQKKFIPNKDAREVVILKLPRPGNLDPVKKLDDFLVEKIGPIENYR